MALCSLKRPQWNQWTRLHCLYLHLPKSTFLEGLCNPEDQIEMARNSLEESVLWQSLVHSQPLPPRVKLWLPSSSIDFRDFPGSHSHNAHHNLLALSWWKVGTLKEGPPFPWAVECKSGQQVPSSFSSSGSGLAWTSTETQCALHCIEQPMQLAALHFFGGFFLTLKHQEVKNVLWSQHILEALHLRSEKIWIVLMLKLSW